MPLCFPGQGAPEVQEGLPWQEKLGKCVTASKRKAVPTSCCSSEGHLEKGAAGKRCLVLGCSLVWVLLGPEQRRGCRDTALLSCCHRERRWCVSCLPGRECCQHSAHMEVLVVYVHFRSSAYIHKIAEDSCILGCVEWP